MTDWIEAKRRAKTCREMADILYAELQVMDEVDQASTVTYLMAKILKNVPATYEDSCLILYGLLLLYKDKPV